MKLHGDIKSRVQALIFIRIVVVTILLDSLYLFKIGYERLTYPSGLAYFIAVLYFLTIVYALVLRWISSERQYIRFAYVQVIEDIISEAILFYMTGGIASLFAFLFPLSIISAGILLDRRACYITAALSSILYGITLDLQFYKIISISSSVFYTEKDFLYNAFAHITAFLLVGYLSGYLSDRLSIAAETLRDKDTVLSDLKAFSEYIIESMPSGIFTTDLQRNIISFNAAAQDITGMTSDSVTGRTIEGVFPFLAGSGDTLDRAEGELERQGQRYPIGMRLSRLRDSAGKPIGLIGVFQDLTRMKAMEAEVKKKEKWAYIGELSASIAHELRNPLAALKGSVEMLREKKVSEEHAEHLMQIALSEMDRLNGIITDFLIYARPRPLQREPFDLHQSLANIVTLLQGSASGAGDVTISSEIESPLTTYGDSKQLQQVFWNLGLNALDAVEEGGRIMISAEKRKDSTEIIFSDTGRGISSEDMERVFFPFFTTKE